MRQLRLMTGFDMEQHSHPDMPPMNPVPTTFEQHSLQEPYDNNTMFNGLPQYHHHQGASNLGPGMSTPPNLYLPYEPSHPLAHHGASVGVSSAVHESNPHLMGHGYKRKSAEAISGDHHYLTESAASSSFQQLNTPETAPFPFPHYATPTYPQPIDQRSVRSRVGADPPYSHDGNSFVQGNYGAHPFSPPVPIWYDQHCNDNTSDESSSFWLQPPSITFMHGNAVTSSTGSGSVCLPRFHEASSSRNDVPFVHPRPNYFSHHQAPLPTVYPHMASASYTVPMIIHDASYSHVGAVQSTGFRMNQQHPRDDFSPEATLRHHGLPHLREIPLHEDADFWEGDFFDSVNHVDHHQDMRLDIEDMSYEELLALSDHIGTVKTGLSEETVKDLVKRRTSVSTKINLEEAPPSTDLETDSCTICQETYKNQDKIVTLDCKHEYHAECLEKWLVIKNVCPICKSVALVVEKNKERSSRGGEVPADSN